jgi:hypothetical protein
MSLNGHPIVVLFYSGATHNFNSKACTQNCQLTITQLSTPYMISTLGGKTVTQYLAKNTPLNLGGKVYKTGLIFLDSQRIDVILGMSWMKEFKALLDIAARGAPGVSSSWQCCPKTPVTNLYSFNTSSYSRSES